jgi:hypothetical protein
MSLRDMFVGLSERIERERRKPDEAIALGEASALLAALRLRYTVTLEGDKVSVRGSTPPDEQTCARIRELKPALMRVLESER